MTGAEHAAAERHQDEGDEVIVEDDAAAEAELAAGETAERKAAWRGPSIGRWVLFAALAVGVVVVDQLSKAWLAGQLDPGEMMIVLGEWLRFVHGQNSGILFGLLPQSAPAFAIVSLGVTALIVVYHYKAGRGIVTTLALGLLLGGAIGNLLDRLNHGYVIDWIDMGIGTLRFWTYNVADAAISTAIVLLIAMAIVPRIAEWGADD
jgi:signal peptidase II